MVAVAEKPHARQRSLTPQGQRRLSNPARLPTAAHSTAASNAQAPGRNRTPPRNGPPPWNPGGLAPPRRILTPPRSGTSRTPPRDAGSAASAMAPAAWAWHSNGTQENCANFPGSSKNPLLRASTATTGSIVAGNAENDTTDRRISMCQDLAKHPEAPAQGGTTTPQRRPPAPTRSSSTFANAAVSGDTPLQLRTAPPEATSAAAEAVPARKDSASAAAQNCVATSAEECGPLSRTPLGSRMNRNGSGIGVVGCGDGGGRRGSGNGNDQSSSAAAAISPSAVAPAFRGRENDCVTTVDERLGAHTHTDRVSSWGGQQHAQPFASAVVSSPCHGSCSTEEELCQHWESWAQAVVLATKDGSDLPDIPTALASASQVPQSLLRVIEASTVAATALARASIEKQSLQGVIKSLESELVQGRQHVRRLQDALNEMSEDRARTEANLREDVEEYCASLESANDEVQRLRRQCAGIQRSLESEKTLRLQAEKNLGRPCAHCEDVRRRLAEATAEAELARSALHDSETLRRKEIEDAWCTAETAEEKHRHTIAVLRQLLMANGSNTTCPEAFADAQFSGPVAGRAVRRSAERVAEETHLSIYNCADEIDTAAAAEQGEYGAIFEAEPEEEADDLDEELAATALAPASSAVVEEIEAAQCLRTSRLSTTCGKNVASLDAVAACPNECDIGSVCGTRSSLVNESSLGSSSLTVASSTGSVRRNTRGTPGRYGNTSTSRYFARGGTAGAAGQH